MARQKALTSEDALVHSIQRDFPRIYLGCHVEHTRRKSALGVSAHDASLLAHLAAGDMGAAELARHMHVVPSSLSASLKRLVAGGYLTEHSGTDRRRKILAVTESGRTMMSAHSVLDSARLLRAIKRLTPAERTTVREGLALLAQAAGAL